MKKSSDREASTTKQAIAMIKASKRPVATSDLVKSLGLSINGATVLRRGLRRAEAKGEIMCVTTGENRSFMWTSCSKKTNLDQDCIGAAMAAEVFLQERKGPVRLNIEETAVAIGLNTRPDESDMEVRDAGRPVR